MVPYSKAPRQCPEGELAPVQLHTQYCGLCLDRPPFGSQDKSLWPKNTQRQMPEMPYDQNVMEMDSGTFCTLSLLLAGDPMIVATQKDGDVIHPPLNCN